MSDAADRLDAVLERWTAGDSFEGLLTDLARDDETRSLLTAARQFEALASAPSRAWRTAARSRLLHRMADYSREPLRAPRPVRLRWATAALAAALSLAAVGTAAAQSAVPGHRLYDWKLASERVWRWASSDRLAADVGLLERRTEEWILVRGDSEAEARAAAEFAIQARRLAGYAGEDAVRAAAAVEAALRRLYVEGVMVELEALGLPAEPEAETVDSPAWPDIDLPGLLATPVLPDLPSLLPSPTP